MEIHLFLRTIILFIQKSFYLNFEETFILYFRNSYFVNFQQLFRKLKHLFH